MAFEALDLSLELIRQLRGPLAKLQSRDVQLYRQMRAAASSVALNLAEGRGRSGKDRQYHWRVAAGSAQELRAALNVGVAWGDLDAADLTVALDLVDRVLAMCWRLTH